MLPRPSDSTSSRFGTIDFSAVYEGFWIQPIIDLIVAHGQGFAIFGYVLGKRRSVCGVQSTSYEMQNVSSLGGQGGMTLGNLHKFNL